MCEREEVVSCMAANNVLQFWFVGVIITCSRKILFVWVKAMFEGRTMKNEG